MSLGVICLDCPQGECICDREELYGRTEAFEILAMPPERFRDDMRLRRAAARFLVHGPPTTTEESE